MCKGVYSFLPSVLFQAFPYLLQFLYLSTFRITNVLICRFVISLMSVLVSRTVALYNFDATSLVHFLYCVYAMFH